MSEMLPWLKSVKKSEAVMARLRTTIVCGIRENTPSTTRKPSIRSEALTRNSLSSAGASYS